ncbi:MAG: glycosyltransferase, partial [Sphingomonas sp.]
RGQGLRNWLHRLNGEHHHADRTARALTRFAEEIGRRTAGSRPDFIFSPESIPVTRLRAPAPIVVSQYQTFMERIAHLPYEQQPPSMEYVRQALDQEREAFANSAVCAFPSARSLACVAQMQDDSGDLEMTPWGANLRVEPDGMEVRGRIRQRVRSPLRLLFASEIWAAGGGGIALETCRELHRRGIEFHLDILGATPPIAPPAWATVIRREGEAGLPDLLEDPGRYRFLLAPLRIDARPHLLCEAAAHGIPAITTDIGGLSSVVADGVSGLCLPPGAGPAEWADALVRLAVDRDAYVRMADDARARYDTTLNWHAFARRVIDLGRAARVGDDRPSQPWPIRQRAFGVNA